MSSVGRLFVAFGQARCWACLGLIVLLLGLQVRGARANDAAQVQLDVVVAQVRRGLTRSVVPHFLKRSRQAITDARGQLQPFAGVLDSPADAEAFRSMLQALHQEGLGKVVAEPRLVTLNGQQASFLAGGEQAVPVPRGWDDAGVEFVEFGLRVNLTPTLLGHGRLWLEAASKWSTLGDATQQVHTATDLKAGQAVLLGGLVQPWVTNKDKDEVELVVLVTPSPAGPQPPRPSATPHGPGKEGGERLQQLEHRLRQVQEEMDELRRELRSLRPAAAADPDE
jgi:Flp pilus assembly secretin CpaC